MKIDWSMVVTFITLVPLALRISSYFGSLSNNKNIQTLSQRAIIIAEALEQTDFTGAHKKDIAIEKLMVFAQELAIKLTKDQAGDYVESAVVHLQTTGVKQ